MAEKQKTPDFEKSLAELEAIVEKLEGGELSLEASLKAFETGVSLTRQCRDALEKAEQKVSKLLGEDEQAGLGPFEEHGDGENG